MSGIEEITYALDFCANKRSRRESTATPHPSPADGNDSSIPRIARLMALAIRFDGLLRGETFRDYAELAEPERLPIMCWSVNPAWGIGSKSRRPHNQGSS